MRVNQRLRLGRGEGISFVSSRSDRAWLREFPFRKAKEYLFTGDWLSADEALRLGLVNRVRRKSVKGGHHGESANLSRQHQLLELRAVAGVLQADWLQGVAGFQPDTEQACH